MSKVNTNSMPIHKAIKVWLLIGLFMVFIQVLVGGITRLTDSGLSITEWAVIQGTIPPLNEVEWVEAFDKYKVAAKKQYETLHADMTLSEFKVIFFWEYMHRLWARTMGFVFLFPFIYFLWKKWMPKWMVKMLGVVIFLAATEALMGWIMVASGLNNDDRTWVSAYKLVAHLTIAAILFGYLYWIYLRAAQPKTSDSHLKNLKRWSWGLTTLVMIQIVFGGLMAGMRAGLIHPYFPFFIEGERLMNALSASANIENVVDYEPSIYIKAWVQVLHRTTAYVLVILSGIYVYKSLKHSISQRLRIANYMLITLLISQFLLGVLTVINCFGKVPVLYGSLHQGLALILLITLLYNNYQYSNRTY